MEIKQETGSYNGRRYSRPWIAKVTSWTGVKPTLKWGNFISNAEDGGIMVIDAEVGDIIRYGQKDNRGNGTENSWAIVEPNGSLRRVTPAEAYQSPERAAIASRTILKTDE